MTLKLTGLIGYPTAHSLSPHIHAYWFAKYNIEGEYKLLTTKPARLRQTMLHMRKKHAAGLNVTVPHKQAVMEYLDAIDDTAKTIGAVNTITNENGRFIGTNTDAYGFLANLKETLGDLTPYLKDVVFLGAGGATRASIVALKKAGAGTITLLNRTQETAQTLADAFNIVSLPWEVRNDALAEATLLVNTTSLGMEHHPALTIDLTLLPPTAAVHDIVYAPLETELLHAARLRGHPTVDGLGMLLCQAQKAFETWHGMLPEVTQELRTHIVQLAQENAAQQNEAAAASSEDHL